MITPPNAPILISTIGPAGAGKSWLMNHLGLKPTQQVNLDMLRGMVCDDPGDQKATDDAVPIQRQLLGIRARRRLLTAVVDTNLRQDVREWQLQLAGKHRLFTVAFVLDTPEGVCKTQDAQRTGSERLGEEVIEKIYAKFVKEIPAFGPIDGYAMTVRFEPAGVTFFGDKDPVGIRAWVESALSAAGR